jgi:hypothetical protein
MVLHSIITTEIQLSLQPYRQMHTFSQEATELTVNMVSNLSSLNSSFSVGNMPCCLATCLAVSLSFCPATINCHGTLLP